MRNGFFKFDDDTSGGRPLFVAKSIVFFHPDFRYAQNDLFRAERVVNVIDVRSIKKLNIGTEEILPIKCTRSY